MDDKDSDRPAPKDANLSDDDQKANAPGIEGPAKKTRRTRSKAQRELDRKARAAKKFPHGPEAQELAELEPPMPQSLRDRIAQGNDHALWREGFEWTVARLRLKVRDGKRFYPRNVIKELRAAYPTLDLREDDLEWLEGWLGYLKLSPAALRSDGKYGPRVVIVDALGAREDIYAAIDNLDRIFPNESGRSAPSLAPRTVAEDLPSPPRDMPFRFNQLTSSTAKTFWRAYWESRDTDELREAGKLLAADPWAKEEMRKLGTEAEAFFIKTMAKLGIPLS